MKTLDKMIAEYVEKVLKHYDYNVVKTCEVLVVSRSWLYNTVKKHKIEMPERNKPLRVVRRPDYRSE